GKNDRGGEGRRGDRPETSSESSLHFSPPNRDRVDPREVHTRPARSRFRAAEEDEAAKLDSPAWTRFRRACGCGCPRARRAPASSVAMDRPGRCELRLRPKGGGRTTPSPGCSLTLCRSPEM